MAQVVAVLGKGVVDPSQPILLADDLGPVRGDGLFETINVRQGVAWQLEPHLERMARSAAKMDIELPSLASIRELCEQALTAFGTESEGALRLICTRGLETGSAPTLWATLNPVPDSQRNARRDGLKLLELSLGYPADARARSPWLLGGAKTTSYAVTMSAIRYAQSKGYDDALWTSEDGYLLEGPTSTLVWLNGETLYTVPSDTGILIGTTAAFLFENAHELGLKVGEERIRPADLTAVDGAWMTSSVRGVAPVRSLDNVELNQSPRTAELQKLAGFPTPE
ncbi:aminotransferase class IV [Stackebrandtia nassauensis]|uniref:Aminotransferase class IV n=1 Tax=Stackebrandtia nassauensis (strain DSM 44728 / CIP 108903 / NRRL B-16338 / NBRC 102104 / LLR-40K-21) TaxID=446470 RepID=D3PY08_STANL|nr:aminotransferase class IV [Stackebrandtia nassauensis]ADD45337.1 aminotransferase class IV [Stackebrandtia nassauensis DSM 44728]